MLAVRRILRIVAFVGTLMVGVLAVALIVSQTPWFCECLRRFIVREANQYLNGGLAIGGLGGSLFYGISLSDVSLNVSGEHIIAIKNIDVGYNAFSVAS